MAQRTEDVPLRTHLRIVGLFDALDVDLPPAGGAMSSRPTSHRLRVELVVVRIAAVIGVLLAVPWTVVAFVGGTFQPFPFETSGGMVLGFVWLIIVDPALVAAVVLGVDRIMRLTRPRPARADRG